MPNPPKIITIGSDSLTLKQWSAKHGVSVTTICSRLHLGWTAEDAVKTPIDRRFRPTNRAPKGAVRPCPKLRHHKATGQAYCEWVTAGDRTVKYFGKWDSEEANQAYARFQLGWATRLVRRSTVAPGESVLVCELMDAWLDYCRTGDDGEGGYLKRGKLTSGIHAQTSAMNYLKSHRSLGVDEFGPDQLREVRKGMIDSGLLRKTINGYQSAIVQMFGWGVGRQLVHPDVWNTLKHVGLLQKGKTIARDNPKKKAVPWTDVEAVFPHLHTVERCRAVLEAMIRVHWYLGGRPQDICGMRVGDLDRSGEVWHYVVDRHKNEHREQDLGYWVGPRCQAIIGPFLEGKASGDLLFVYPPLKDSGSPTPIRRDIYGNRVKDACKAAGVKPWTPHQLRHSRATEVMRIFESNEAAAAAIGDSPEVTRAVYVDPLDAVRKRIARETG